MAVADRFQSDVRALQPRGGGEWARFQSDVRALQPRGGGEVSRFQQLVPNIPIVYPTLNPAFSPADASSVLRTATITIPITVATLKLISTLRIYVEYSDGTAELVLSQSTFGTNFDALSSLVGGVGSQTASISVRPDVAWPTSAFSLRVFVTDSAGAASSFLASYTVSNPADGPQLNSDFSPASGSSILTTASISVPITTDTPAVFESLTLWATFSARSELVYRSGGFIGPYTGSALVGGVGSASAAFTVTRTGGWPENFSLSALVRDSLEFASTFSASYTVSNPPGDPVVSVVSPAPGSEIERTTPIVVDVTDESPGVRTMIWVGFGGSAAKEVVWDGTDFPYPYASSSRSAITNGFRYSLIRSGGWVKAPHFYTRSIDSEGNEDD